MQRVALEDDQRPRWALRCLNGVLVHQPGQTGGVRHPEILALEGFLVVVLRRATDAGDKILLGTRNQHQRAVELVVVGHHDGTTEAAHARHAILAVPGFEIGMPVEPLAFETGLVVDPRLVNVDLAVQQLTHDVEKVSITGQPVKALRNVMNAEDGSNLLLSGLKNGALRQLEVVIVLVVFKLFDKPVHLVLGEEGIKKQKPLSSNSRTCLADSGPSDRRSEGVCTTGSSRSNMPSLRSRRVGNRSCGRAICVLLIA